ncbi:tyrosine-type recombinase/integrase [Mucilaginibacter terrae]|uniref:tyrosine-type recombinase/integrase n=1 Tax=Mucilaginibacter terrae TaxID=1955052 RepID=UPI003624E1E3
MPLIDLNCRHAKPKEKAYRIFDTNGLYLSVMPSGTKVWRYKYRFLGKEKLLTIGHYPAISLVLARQKRDVAKELIAGGIDPAADKQDQKNAVKHKAEQTFEVVATEWHTHFEDTWEPRYAKHITQRLKMNAYPFIGSIPIAELTAHQLLTCLQRIEGRGRSDLAKRMLSLIGQVLRYAVITGRTDRDVSVFLKGALKKYKKGHHAAINSDQLPDFLRTLEKNERRLYPQTIYAIRLMLLTFVRTNELIGAKWEEFNFEKAIWIVPAERMKMRIEHIVPLSKQVIAILNELKNLYGGNGFILPSIVNPNKHISNNTILKGLDALGYHKIMTGHGFRALAMSTIKEKLHYRHEVVDRQLAHLPKSKIDQAYDRAQFLPQRVKMMQKWADFIDNM